MSIYNYYIALAIVGLVTLNGVAMAQDPAAGCAKADTPEQLEGQVVKVDVQHEKVTIRDNTGKLHEFQASKETLQEYKAGDTIKAKLRCEK